MLASRHVMHAQVLGLKVCRMDPYLLSLALHFRSSAHSCAAGSASHEVGASILTFCCTLLLLL